MSMYMCVCLCLYVCVSPHPWTASSAWSAWSAYPPQPPCLPSSSWKQASLCMLKSVSLRHVFGRLKHTYTPLTLFPLLLLLLLSQWLLLAETLFLSSLLSCFLTPSHSAPPLFLSPLFSPHSPTLYLPPIPLFFIRGCSLPPSLSHSPSLPLPPTFTASQEAEQSISDSL